MKFIIVTIVLFLLELLYFKIAKRYKIIDSPNQRSSHSRITIRGGGIIFPIAILLAFFLGYISGTVTWTILLVATISFVDDIKPISRKTRFGFHVIAVLLIAHELNLFDDPFWALPLVLVVAVGWINAFNFMDGINGITVLYALSAILCFSYLPVNASSIPLLTVMGISCMVFGFFNIRTKAKTFAGDVGSVSMGLFLGYFMIKTIVETEQIGYILFFSVYGIDAIFTIIYRIGKRENIFEAHRSHLYQYLANECGYSQVGISIIYATLQLLINILIIYLDVKGSLSLFATLGILLVLSLFYLVVRGVVVRKIGFKKQENNYFFN
ncbi:glycosyltransferase family 4 protein [uncultured Flavobacterium sp.]|uniref:MraY family glycosyltransferase n=1 Tax=uncultured Flavobacterium sp. TaxID=165435 RepID=UPI0030CA3408